METRAHHVLIGVVTLLAAAALLAFIAWAGQYGGARKLNYYQSSFEGSVSGLKMGSPVRYLGIPVGEVHEIGLDPREPTKVRVILKIEERDDIKIRRTEGDKQGTTASLELNFVSGEALVQLSGGSADAPVLRGARKPGADLPKIATEKSGLSELFASAPQVFSQAVDVLTEIKGVLIQNRENVANIMQNISTITGAVAKREEEIDRILINFAKASDELPGVMRNVDGLLQREVPTALTNVGALAQDGSKLIRDNEEALNAFTERGLAQFGSLVMETRLLVATLGRVANRLESDPSGFFFGGAQSPEIDVGSAAAEEPAAAGQGTNTVRQNR